MDEWMEFTKGTMRKDDVTLMIIEIDPAYKDLVDYRERGFSHLLHDKYDAAIEELEKALEINSKDEKTHLYLGECYLKNEDYAKSVEHLNRFLKKNEVDANVWYHLSQAYYNLGDYDLALKTSQKAAQLRNYFIEAMIISGLSLKNLDRMAEAEKVWMKVLIYDENNETAKKEVEGS